MPTGNPNAAKIPTSNVVAMPSMLLASNEPAMQMAYSYQPAGSVRSGSSSFIGAFCRKNDEMPSWARDYAEWDYDNFHRNTPGRLKRYSDIDSQLAAGDAKDYLNYKDGWELWDKSGRQGPEPYTTQQDYGSCVDASTTELLTALCGVRAANPANNEIFKRCVAWYFYADRGYCGDGWYFGGLAAVAMQTGIAFRQQYSYGGKTVDFTDDDDNEQWAARTVCRSGIPTSLSDQTSSEHPFEDGAFTEFDGDAAGLLKIFAAGGGINTGGTNTSGGHKPYTPGRVGGHEQSGVAALNSEEWRRFSQDVIGVKLADNDFAIVMNQTWGAGFGGECADQYWPPWLGHKPQGAWIAKASQILSWFSGDIWSVLPRFKGFANPNPVPVPIPPVPVPPGPTPPPSPQPAPVEIYIPADVKAGRYLLFPKADL